MWAQAHPAEGWAQQFEEENGKEADLTPEQRKALKGPSPDDPLEDPDAPSWVAQFNEELRNPTSNQAPGMTNPLFGSLLFAYCRLKLRFES